MKYLNAFFSCFFIFILFSCDIVTFDKDSVSSNPGSEVAWYEGNTVDFTFSCDVIKYYAEQAVYIKSGTVLYENKYNWNGKTLSVAPKEGWEKGRTYKVYIDGTMYNKNGSTFEVYDCSDFIYGKADERFTLLTYSPINEQCSALDLQINLTFNKSVNRTDFDKAFSISPGIQFKTVVSEDNTSYTIMPAGKWNLNTLYEWKIKDIKSSDGWILPDEIKGSFQTENDMELPCLDYICPVTDDSKQMWLTNFELDKHITGKQAIGIAFTKEMDFSSVKNNISFSPMIDGYFMQDENDGKKFIFVPETFYTIDETYYITIAQGIEDTKGLKTADKTCISFIPLTHFMEISSVSINGEIIREQDIITKKLPEDEMTIQITFSTAMSKENLSKFSGQVYLNLLFPLTSETPVKTFTVWNKECTILTITWSNITVSANEYISYYQLKIPGGKSGITGSNGTYLKEDFTMVIVPKKA